MRIKFVYGIAKRFASLVFDKQEGKGWQLLRHTDPVKLIQLEHMILCLQFDSISDIPDILNLVSQDGSKDVIQLWIWDDAGMIWITPTQALQLENRRNEQTQIQSPLHHDHDIGGEG